MGSQPINSTRLGPLLQFLPPGSCRPVPAVASFSDGLWAEWGSPTSCFLPKFLMSIVFITTIESKIESFLKGSSGLLLNGMIYLKGHTLWIWGWNENGPHGLLGLNTWIPGGRTDWKGSREVALLDEACHQGQIWSFKWLPPFPGCSLSASCFVDRDLISRSHSLC